MLMIKQIILSLVLVAGLSSAVIAAELVDINKASVSELSEGLSGIGEQKAAAIVAYRDSHGAFTSLDDLQNVKGIGSVTVEKLRDKLTVQTPPIPANKAN